MREIEVVEEEFQTVADNEAIEGVSVGEPQAEIEYSFSVGDSLLEAGFVRNPEEFLIPIRFDSGPFEGVTVIVKDFGTEESAESKEGAIALSYQYTVYAMPTEDYKYDATLLETFIGNAVERVFTDMMNKMDEMGGVEAVTKMAEEELALANANKATELA